MKKYRIEISQNGWEYTGYALVKCNELKKIANKKVVADGIEIEFDEEVGDIKEVEMKENFDW
ncbi:hypothetical protein [Neobacillus sp. DY30]|uniref:hypothetical protein n=1 Tax=Neobacillus sp. DY30 TaxID=3047871 RepID=UPI0024BF5423|nr:hypothetical protein [Neobacillus sp. DY30]WHY01846.1 hypothetical protein QNH29_06355 [Neobacillus sp. DY30]